MVNNFELSQLKRKADGLLESCLLNQKYDCVIGFLEFHSKKNSMNTIELCNHLIESVNVKYYSADNKELMDSLLIEIMNILTNL